MPVSLSTLKILFVPADLTPSDQQVAEKPIDLTPGARQFVEEIGE